ncbi:A/G-specific adenine glycosylase [bacterium]|nr:A/G-specific adenine glycosylase [bacterium]NCT19759.1 A/G-specific adenine glycosylase [bacterium]
MPPFAQAILAWYERNARRLPWRGHPDPYAVWLSEIMLQQTRVETVIPYFHNWLKKFPTLASLAAAPQQAALAAWEGLGYYSRARNFQRAAQIIVSDYAGQIPKTAEELIRLPGIGRYTAAAIASIAFGQDIATLDGNLKRIFARVFDVTDPIDTPAGEKKLWQLAENHLPPGRAGDYNQALMDLGASVCLPRSPLCPQCPLESLCEARAFGLQAERPVRTPKKPVPQKYKLAAVLLSQGKTLLNQRPANGLLGGLWEFPAAEVTSDSAEACAAALQTAYRLKVTPRTRLPAIRHAYSHFTLTETPWRCDLLCLPPDSPLQWIPLADLPAYPMGKVDRAIANQLTAT